MNDVAVRSQCVHSNIVRHAQQCKSVLEGEVDEQEGQDGLGCLLGRRGGRHGDWTAEILDDGERFWRVIFVGKLVGKIIVICNWHWGCPSRRSLVPTKSPQYFR